MDARRSRSAQRSLPQSFVIVPWVMFRLALWPLHVAAHTVRCLFGNGMAKPSLTDCQFGRSPVRGKVRA
jgi:hypothetical protein